jgi:hypothetical protein
VAFEIEGRSKLAEDAEVSVGFSQLENGVRGRYLHGVQPLSHLNRNAEDFPFFFFFFDN